MAQALVGADLDLAADVSGDLAAQVTVPEGVSAVVRLPGLEEQRVGGGEHEFRAPAAAAVPAG